MLREVIASLYGYPGCFYVCNRSDNSIQVQPGLDFLHPAEESLLQRLCFLGNQFKKIENFAVEHVISKEKGPLYGLYVRSFADSLNIVIKPYRTDLWKLELEVMRDPHISLTHLLRLERYLPLFQKLLEVIDTLEKDKVHGCQILEVLYRASYCGLPMVEESLQRILKECHVVLMRQIRQWMVCGVLSDPYEEFFIALDETANQQFLNSSPKNPKLQYCLKPELLPCYIPHQVASKILFTGECARILGSNAMDAWTKPTEFSHRQDEFADKLLELIAEEKFSVLKFSSVVTEIRTCAAKQMWKVIVEDAKLLSFLQNMKGFYLLGRGELFQCFIDTANKCLKMPLTTTTLIEVKSAFHSAVFLSSPNGNSIVKTFNVILQEKKDSQTTDKDSLSKTTLETGWSTIGLICEVPHPLDVVFTPSVLDRYNMIFRFLLGIRRVQIELNHCFVLQMSNKGLVRNTFPCLLWQLRAQMSFLIDNFQFYLQVDVLDTQFSDLIEQIKENKDFGTLQQSHLNFLVSIMSQSFLQLKPVYCCLLDILDLCSSFCSYINKSHNSNGNNEMAMFETVRMNFQRQTSLLFRVLCGIKSHRVSPHLAQFMLRLDYNKYLSSSGGHLGGPLVRKL